jgi:hypothetical protein
MTVCLTVITKFIKYNPSLSNQIYCPHLGTGGGELEKFANLLHLGRAACFVLKELITKQTFAGLREER